MSKTKRVGAIALAAALGCTVFAGCDLISTNIEKDYQQVIAEVDISQSEDFAEGGKYAAYSDVVSNTEITKLDMVAYFVSTGYAAMQQNGWTYYDTFAMISEALVNRAIYIQYAMVYLLDNGSDADGTKKYSVDDFNSAVADAKDSAEHDLLAVQYFLTDEERARAEYNTRVLFNNTIDTQEESIIGTSESDTSSDTVRTTPTGVDTANDQYYDSAYRVYTGSNALSDCGTYEAVEGSTTSTRTKAYNNFIANLLSNNLITTGEDVSDIESLTYYSIELQNAYEDILISKMSDLFEKQAEDRLNNTSEEGEQTVIEEEYDKLLAYQQQAFEDESTFTNALDGMADDSFVLTAPAEGYGYVVNILIPFTTTQSNELTNADQDFGDPNGNKFKARSELLQKVRGTDQRGTWVTGGSDYAFKYDASKFTDAYTGGDENRDYLFFEKGVEPDPEKGERRYERIPNYFGRYTYNGTITERDDGTFTATPNRISINKFITEMNSYLDAASSAITKDGDGYKVSGSYVNGVNDAGELVSIDDDSESYYKQTYEDYYSTNEDGTPDFGSVDYSKFIYYAGKVDFTSGGKTSPFNANELFLEGSAENVAYSVINELSFAYNTDTAGLNTYLGYSITIGKTDFVSEFEYAAQYVCRQGAGSYVVVPSDYGWHIIYCTFSYLREDGASEEDSIVPFVYDDSLKDVEGTFSNLFYEALRADIVQQYQSLAQTNAINAYESCATVYEERYADLSGLDTAN